MTHFSIIKKKPMFRNIIPAFIILVFLCTFHAQVSSSAAYDEFLNEGRRNYEQGDYEFHESTNYEKGDYESNELRKKRII